MEIIVGILVITVVVALFGAFGIGNNNIKNNKGGLNFFEEFCCI